MRRPALGKGLGELLGQAELADALVREIPIDQIRPNPYQPRRQFAEEALHELAASIKAMGVLQPIIVRQEGERDYVLIAGERRLRAAKLAGLTTIPAIVRSPTEQQMLEMALVENLQREDINPIDAALAYKRLMDEFGLTMEQVAQRVGKSVPAISNTLRLLQLPEYIINSLREGTLSEGHGRALLMVKDPVQQRQLWSDILSERLSVRAAELRARELRAMNPTPRNAPADAPQPSSVPETIKALEHNLSAYLGTRVQVVQWSGGGGRIVIEFYSEEELGRILEIIAPHGF
ncbi:MAG: ParB/RepB/Spo0J family partition protein [Fimbriimonadales bacterium]|nr:ParB/RepB/Spo0J family partition protein [Fimbriimonadales bacterium]MDW8051804.1 ParB/RepB/Spo0J family partition protein [Armatimonadota bacterium]